MRAQNSNWDQGVYHQHSIFSVRLSPDVSIAWKWNFYRWCSGGSLSLSELQRKRHFLESKRAQETKVITQETDLSSSLWSCILDRPVLSNDWGRRPQTRVVQREALGARSKSWMRSPRWKINFHFQGTKELRVRVSKLWGKNKRKLLPSTSSG